MLGSPSSPPTDIAGGIALLEMLSHPEKAKKALEKFQVERARIAEDRHRMEAEIERRKAELEVWETKLAERQRYYDARIAKLKAILRERS